MEVEGVEALGLEFVGVGGLFDVFGGIGPDGESELGVARHPN